MNWEIIDNGRTIHAGTEEEMDSAWDVMICKDLPEYLISMNVMDTELTNKDNIESLIEIYHKWYTPHYGDMKLIEIHKIHK